MSEQMRKKFQAQISQFAFETFPGEDNKDERNLFEVISSEYYTGVADDSKLNDCVNQLSEEAERRNFFINKIKTLKVKNMTKPEGKTEVKSKVGQEEKKNDERKKENNQKDMNEEKGEGQKNEKVRKPKIFQRIEGTDRPSKKPKLDQGQKEKVEGEDAMKENLKKKLENEGKQKCRFFPFCKNEETCQFFHPTEKVQRFSWPSKQEKITPQAVLQNINKQIQKNQKY